MALITCSECGKEVSDKATTCPNCGCPMTDILTAVQNKELQERTRGIDYEIDGDTTYCKACQNCGAVSWNTTADGYKNGYCIECRGAKLYDKLVKIDFTTREFNDIVGQSPDMMTVYNHSRYMKLSEQWRKHVYDLERKLYEQYVCRWETLDKNCRPYKLNIECLYSNSQGEAHSQIMQEAQEKVANIPPKIHSAKCPNCGSPSVKKLSDTSKGVSFALFGVFSSSFGKQFYCNNCGYKW